MNSNHPGPRPAALEAHDVVRRYGDHRAGLAGLSLTIAEGTIYGLLGPNGSGKSTFLSLVAGRQMPDEGSITVFGKVPSAETRQETGVVFQESTLDPLASVGDNLELSGRLFGLTRRDCRERGERLLAELGLGSRFGDRVGALSGGMRRRVEIARSLLHAPRLLLMDEPTTGIDAEEREIVWSHLREFVGAGGTVVLATNDLLEAERVCTEAAFLQDGRVVGAGTPADLMAGLRRESIIIDWTGDPDEARHSLGRVEGVASVDIDGPVVQLAVDNAASVAPRLFAVAGGSIVGLRIRPATLADAYFQYVARRTVARAAIE